MVEKASYITKVILNEEQRFMETLDAGEGAKAAQGFFVEKWAHLRVSGCDFRVGKVVWKSRR